MITKHKKSGLWFECIKSTGDNSKEINDWINHRICEFTDSQIKHISHYKKYILVDLYSRIEIITDFEYFNKEYTQPVNKELNGVCAFSAKNNLDEEFVIIIYRKDSPFYKLENDYDSGIQPNYIIETNRNFL